MATNKKKIQIVFYLDDQEQKAWNSFKEKQKLNNLNIQNKQLIFEGINSFKNKIKELR